MEPIYARVKLLVVLAVAFTIPLGAQEPVTTLPTQPDSTLTPEPDDAGFASWLRTQREAGQSDAPILIQAGRFEVLAMSPLARASLEPDSVFAPMLASCAETMRLAEAQVIQVGALRPWREFEEAAARVPVIAFSIIPSHAAPVNCGASVSARHAALGRGIRFVGTPAYNKYNDARRVELWANGTLIVPVLSGSGPVTQVARLALRQDATTQLRIYVPAQRLAPDDRGRLPQVELRIWNASGEPPDRIPLPVDALRSLWDSELRWRAARIANTGIPSSARPSLPAPRDAALSTALSRLNSGDHRAAAMVASDRLHGEGLEEKDRLTGELILGLAFDAEGDEAAARIAFADAIRLQPCLSFDASVDPRYRRMLDGDRPAARCQTRPLALVAASSLIPGLGQYSTGRRLGMGIAVLGGLTAAFVVGQGKYSEGRAAFAEYEAVTGYETGTPPADRAVYAFRRAEAARRAGNNLMRVGVGIWVLAGVEAILHEYRHARTLRSVQGFGGTTSRVGVATAPGGIGLSVSLFQ